MREHSFRRRTLKTKPRNQSFIAQRLTGAAMKASEQRQAVELAYFEGMTQSEIASKTDLKHMADLLRWRMAFWRMVLVTETDMTGQHANPDDLYLYALGALDVEENQALEAHPAELRRLPATTGRRTAAHRAHRPGWPPVVPAAASQVGVDGKGASGKMYPGRTDNSSQNQEDQVEPALLRLWTGNGCSRVLQPMSWPYKTSDRGKQLGQLQAQVAIQDAATLQAIRQSHHSSRFEMIILLQCRVDARPGPRNLQRVWAWRCIPGRLLALPAGKSYQLWLILLRRARRYCWRPISRTAQMS